ncbi:MAG: hypothetical protein OIF57_06620 [Marinobacterium sp.]|nr:hypothetical protein [Marinobacterium sp.]
MPDATYQRATILPLFYEKIAASIGGKGPCPAIVAADFGHGFVKKPANDDELPVLESVPTNLEEIPKKFYRAELEETDRQLSDGRLIIRCHVPSGSVDTPKQNSMIGLIDLEGDLVAVVQDFPDWITPSDEHTAYAYLDFPHIGENPPEAI